MENNENDIEFDAVEDSEEGGGDSAQRARNRTVMLTPDITGEVRARLAQDLSAGGASTDAPPAESGGFSEPPAFGQGFTESKPAETGFAQFGGSSEPQGAGFGQVISNPAATPAQPAYSQPVAPQAPTQEQHAPSHATGDRIVWVKQGPVIGFLVSFDRDENGEVFPLRTGRLIVTSEAASAGNFLIVNDGTVSPMHAILRMTKTGEIQVLDQLSEHGTQIKRFGSDELEELSGDKGTLEHGDVIYFGERKFFVCVLVRDEEEE